MLTVWSRAILENNQSTDTWYPRFAVKPTTGQNPLKPVPRFYCEIKIYLILFGKPTNNTFITPETVCSKKKKKKKALKCFPSSVILFGYEECSRSWYEYTFPFDAVSDVCRADFAIKRVFWKHSSGTIAAPRRSADMVAMAIQSPRLRCRCQSAVVNHGIKPAQLTAEPRCPSNQTQLALFTSQGWITPSKAQCMTHRIANKSCTESKLIRRDPKITNEHRDSKRRDFNANRNWCVGEKALLVGDFNARITSYEF